MKKIFWLILTFSLSIECYGQTIEECFNLATKYREKSDWSSLIYYCNKGIELNPKIYFFYWYRGTAKQQLEDLRGALLDYNTAIKLKPGDNPIIYYDRGIINAKLKKYNVAILDFDMAIKLNLPGIGIAYFGRGIAKIQLGQKESGCLDLSKAGELGYDLAYEIIKKNCND